MELFAEKLYSAGHENLGKKVIDYINSFKVIIASHSIWVPIEKYRKEFYMMLSHVPGN